MTFEVTSSPATWGSLYSHRSVVVSFLFFCRIIKENYLAPKYGGDMISAEWALTCFISRIRAGPGTKGDKERDKEEEARGCGEGQGLIRKIRGS